MHILNLNYLVIYFNFRRELPVDLSEGNLKALSLQGLSQVLEKNFSHILFKQRFQNKQCFFMPHMLWLQVNLDTQGSDPLIILKSCRE